MSLLRHLSLGLLLLSQVQARKNQFIVPGATWYDTSGAVLHGHAGGIVHVASEGPPPGTFYWFGQNEEEGVKDIFSALNVYSSTDLLNWDFRGRALEPIVGTDIDPGRVAERPKAIFSEKLGEWVLWFHSDNATYGLLRQGVATSPNITGPYTFRGAFSPLGGTSQDFGLFQDVDGQAYSLYSNGDADAAHDNLITRLNANFTNDEEVVYTFENFDLEAPAMVFTGKRYYVLMSHKTGYRPNNVVVFSAENIAGPWSVQSYIAPSGTRTFNSQSTMLIKVPGSRTTTYLYCGDQWSTSSDLWDSRYIWLPADINDATGSFTVDWHDLYSIDVKTGLVSFPKGTTYEAEKGQMTGSAHSTVCPTCSGAGIVTGITGNASLTISNIVGTGKPQWVSFYYHNPDGLFGDNRGVSGQSFTLFRFASVVVNGGSPVTLRQRDTNAGIILSMPLNITFSQGSKNTLTISGLDGGPAADLDRIVVYGNMYDD
ncbi:Importin subunit alpha [Mycena kentingensis (nom. inval.)]|nr:Importin subunit alpha [Mycena kentingensis (nom. inval.)]